MATLLLDRWARREARAWHVPEPLSPSQWAEEHRILSRTQSSRPGPWRNANAPYLAGLMDLATRPGVEEITIMKAAQVGVSEAIRNVVAYLAEREPDPVLLVLPDENVGRRIMANRILPLFRGTTGLRELVTPTARDVQLNSISLSNGFMLRLGWAGSPSSLAADPVRVVINDEVDKFPEWSGRESDPITLGYARTRTYDQRRLIINISTPTTEHGLIATRFASCPVKLYYHVPCPHCGQYQRLLFGQLRWPKCETHDPKAEAAEIERQRDAWFECVHCQLRIEEAHKKDIVRRGVWATEQQEIASDGTVCGDWPPGRRVGVHIWAAYCLWTPWWQIAAEYVAAKDDPVALMGFTNSTLGEPFSQSIAPTASSAFKEKCIGAAPAGIIPRWGMYLFASADVQKRCIYYVVRVWGRGMRSRRIDHGIVENFDLLRERVLNRTYPFEDGRNAVAHVGVLGIDTGGGHGIGDMSRTEEVYRFALTDIHRIKALKGMAEPMGNWYSAKHITYTPPGQQRSPLAVVLTLLDTGSLKDLMSSKITARIAVPINPKVGDVPPPSAAPPGQPSQPAPTGNMIDVAAWELNDHDDDEYNRQMASEHKVLVRKGRTQVERWVPVKGGAANHYWDCEVYNLALAKMHEQVLLGPPPPPKPRQTDPQRGWAKPEGKAWLACNRGPIRRKY